MNACCHKITEKLLAALIFIFNFAMDYKHKRQKR